MQLSAIRATPRPELAIGTQIDVLTSRIASLAHLGAKPQEVTDWGYFNGSVLAIGVLRGENEFQVVGSAAMLLPGLAITARHVFQASHEEFKEAGVEPFAIGIRPTGVDHWTIGRVVEALAPNDDIAFLALKLKSQLPAGGINVLHCSTRLPRVGDVMTIAGYRFDRRATAAENDKRPVNHGKMYMSRGPVTAVYPEGRDKTLVTFGAFEIAAGAVDAMSGGAVFDQFGELVGLVSTSFETEDMCGPTTAAWLAPCLGRRVSIPWPPGVADQPLPLIDHLRFVSGREHIASTDDAFTLTHWS